MVETWIDAVKIKEGLAEFFSTNRSDLTRFGNTVNQTFEAFVFAATTEWYRSKSWKVEFIHPKKKDDGRRRLRLKFSTRGRPGGYTYAVCCKGTTSVQIHHQMRVATRAYHPRNRTRANVCLDVAVVEPTDVSKFGSYDFMPSVKLISFGEAKHMSAFAELLVNFIGLVHEMQPQRLKRRRPNVDNGQSSEHPSPFLYVSGFLYHTAEGVLETIERRGWDIRLYSRTKALVESMTLPERLPGREKDTPMTQGTKQPQAGL